MSERVDDQARARLRVVDQGQPPEPPPLLWQREGDDPSWCVDATASEQANAVQLGLLDASAMSASERRAIDLARSHTRARAILSEAEPPPDRRKRSLAILLGLSIGAHALAFGLLAYFGEGGSPLRERRGREQFTDQRVVVPVEVEEVEPEPIEPEPIEPEPIDAQPIEDTSTPRPTAKPRHDHAAEPPAEPAQPPPARRLEGFSLSSEGTLNVGEGEGVPWGSPGGKGTGPGGKGKGGGEPAPALPSEGSGDALTPAEPRGTIVEPEYPPELERRGIEGSVVVIVWIDEHGHVIKAEVADSSGYDAFDHNAEMAAQRQEWTPATRDGEPVASKRRYRIKFKLPKR